VRRQLRGLRRQVHAEPAAVGAAAGKMSGMQKAGAQNHFVLQHAAQTQAAFDFRREKSRLHRAQKSPQGRI